MGIARNPRQHHPAPQRTMRATPNAEKAVRGPMRPRKSSGGQSVQSWWVNTRPEKHGTETSPQAFRFQLWPHDRTSSGLRPFDSRRYRVGRRCVSVSTAMACRISLAWWRSEGADLPSVAGAGVFANAFRSTRLSSTRSLTNRAMCMTVPLVQLHEPSVKKPRYCLLFAPAIARISSRKGQHNNLC